MKKVVSPEVAKAERRGNKDTNHPWKIVYLSADGVPIKKKEDACCGFSCALKKARHALNGKSSPPVKEVRIYGDSNKAPAKFRDGFKNGYFTVIAA
ncbi:MAG: hypothetical protein ABSF56_02570 [Minisyncoccia bacterium]|jgi:hypothetical protein